MKETPIFETRVGGAWRVTDPPRWLKAKTNAEALALLRIYDPDKLIIRVIPRYDLSEEANAAFNRSN